MVYCHRTTSFSALSGSLIRKETSMDPKKNSPNKKNGDNKKNKNLKGFLTLVAWALVLTVALMAGYFYVCFNAQELLMKLLQKIWHVFAARLM